MLQSILGISPLRDQGYESDFSIFKGKKKPSGFQTETILPDN